MADTAATMEGGKRGGKWLTHVKKTMKANKGMAFGKVLKLAKKTYKKHRGGAAEPYAPASAAKTASPVGGRRTRRGTRRSRKH